MVPLMAGTERHTESRTVVEDADSITTVMRSPGRLPGDGWVSQNDAHNLVDPDIPERCRVGGRRSVTDEGFGPQETPEIHTDYALGRRAQPGPWAALCGAISERR